MCSRRDPRQPDVGVTTATEAPRSAPHPTRLAWLDQAVLLGAGLIIYLATLRVLPWHPVLAPSAWGLALLLCARAPRYRCQLTLGALSTGLALGAIGWAVAQGSPEAAPAQLGRLATALAAALSTYLILNALSARYGAAHRQRREVCTQRPAKPFGRPSLFRWAPALLRHAALRHHAWPQPRALWAPTAGFAARWHGLALVLAAAGLPLGEGAGFAGAALLGVLLMLRWRSAAWEILRSPAWRALIGCFALWLGAGLMAIVWQGRGWLEPRALGSLGPFLLAPVCAVSVACVEPRWYRRAITAFVVVLGLSSATAILQYALDLHRDAPLLAPFAHFSSWSQTRVPGTSRMVGGGFFVHRLKMAHVALIGLAILTGRQLFVPLAARRRLLELSALGLIFGALCLTYARGALIGAALGLIATVVWAPRRARLMTAAVTLCAACAIIATPALRGRLISAAHVQLAGDRTLIWSEGVRILQENTLGVGLGNYPALAKARYQTIAAPARVPRTYAHSLVLSAWAETGPLGLVGYVGMWATLMALCLTYLKSRRRQAAAPTAGAAAATGLFAAVALWVVGLTHDVLFHKPVALTFAALVGTVTALLWRPQAAADARRADP